MKKLSLIFVISLTLSAYSISNSHIAQLFSNSLATVIKEEMAPSDAAHLFVSYLSIQRESMKAEEKDNLHSETIVLVKELQEKNQSKPLYYAAREFKRMSWVAWIGEKILIPLDIALIIGGLTRMGEIGLTNYMGWEPVTPDSSFWMFVKTPSGVSPIHMNGLSTYKECGKLISSGVGLSALTAALLYSNHARAEKLLRKHGVHELAQCNEALCTLLHHRFSFAAKKVEIFEQELLKLLQANPINA